MEQHILTYFKDASYIFRQRSNVTFRNVILPIEFKEERRIWKKMKFIVLEKITGDRMDEAIQHYRQRNVKRLAIRVFERNGEPIREKLDIDEMLALWQAIGMRPENLDEFPVCLLSLDAPG